MVYRVYVEKKEEFANEANSLKKDIIFAYYSNLILIDSNVFDH